MSSVTSQAQPSLQNHLMAEYVLLKTVQHTLSCPQVVWNSGSPKAGFKNLFSQLESNALKPRDSVKWALISRSSSLILECNCLISVEVNFS